MSQPDANGPADGRPTADRGRARRAGRAVGPATRRGGADDEADRVGHRAGQGDAHRLDGQAAARRGAPRAARRGQPRAAGRDLRALDRRAVGGAVARPAGGAATAGAAVQRPDVVPERRRAARSPRRSSSAGSRACSTGSRPRCSPSSSPPASSSSSCASCRRRGRTPGPAGSACPASPATVPARICSRPGTCRRHSLSGRVERITPLSFARAACRALSRDRFVHPPPRPHRVLDARRGGAPRRAGGQGGRRRAAGDRHHRSRQHVRHARVLQGVPASRASSRSSAPRPTWPTTTAASAPPGAAASTTRAATPRAARSSTTTSRCWPRTRPATAT